MFCNVRINALFITFCQSATFYLPHIYQGVRVKLFCGFILSFGLILFWGAPHKAQHVWRWQSKCRVRSVCWTCFDITDTYMGCQSFLLSIIKLQLGEWLCITLYYTIVLQFQIEKLNSYNYITDINFIQTWISTSDMNIVYSKTDLDICHGWNVIILTPPP